MLPVSHVRGLRPRPHPSTYILLPDVETCRDDEVFIADVGNIRPRTLNYQKSCPALTGTASGRLRSSWEESNVSAVSTLSTSISDSHGSNVYSNKNYPPRLNNNQKRLTKKRSFLLTDILDDMEGRPPAKRIDKSQSIEVPNHRASGFVSTQESYEGHEHNQGHGCNALCDVLENDESRQACTNQTEQDVCKISTPSRGRSRQLRSRKSIVAMSIDRARALSPSGTRLDAMELDQITSFDAFFDSSQGFKAEAAATKTAFCASAVLSHGDAAQCKTANDQRQFSRKRNFSSNTRRLQQMPLETDVRTTCQQLRHAKSAKDILHVFDRDSRASDSAHETRVLRTSAPGNANIKQNDRNSSYTCAKKRLDKENYLRDGLRKLLSGRG